MSPIDGVIERLRSMHARADHASPGAFKFVSSVSTANGECACVIVLALTDTEARQAAAKALGA